MPAPAPRFRLNFEDLKKIGKGAIVAAIGAAVAAVAQAASTTDLGIWGPILGGLVSIAANALQKFTDAPK